jgi:hypothetical protein
MIDDSRNETSEQRQAPAEPLRIRAIAARKEPRPPGISSARTVSAS